MSFFIFKFFSTSLFSLQVQKIKEAPLYFSRTWARDRLILIPLAPVCIIYDTDNGEHLEGPGGVPSL